MTNIFLFRSWKLEAGSWKPEARSQKLEARRKKFRIVINKQINSV